MQGVGIGDGTVDCFYNKAHYDTYLYTVGAASNELRMQLFASESQMQTQITRGNTSAGGYMNDILDSDQQKYMGGIVLENFERYTYDPKYYSAWITANRDNFGIPHNMPFTNFPGNSKMGQAFYPDFGVSFSGDIDYLLTKTKVLIYNGQLDIIVNTPGVEAYVNMLEWSGLGQWQQTKKSIFTMDQNKVVGNYKHYSNFTFVVLYGSGHYIPHDVP